LIFARQLLFFSDGWLVASKGPLEDAVEPSDADKEENHPGGVRSHSHRIIIGNLVRAVRSGEMIHQEGSDHGSHHAEHYSSHHTWEKEIANPGPSGTGHGCTAHDCPP